MRRDQKEGWGTGERRDRRPGSHPGHRGQTRGEQLRLLGMVAPSASTSTYTLVPTGKGKAIERVYSPKGQEEKKAKELTTKTPSSPCTWNVPFPQVLAR